MTRPENSRMKKFLIQETYENFSDAGAQVLKRGLLKTLFK